MRSPATRPVRLEHRGFHVEVTRKDVKTLRLRVQRYTGEIRLSVPRRAPMSTVYAFLDANLDWLADARHRMQSVEPPAEKRLSQLTRVPLWGNELELEVRHGPRATATRNPDGSLLLTGPDDAGLRRALDALYRRELGRVAEGMLAAWQPVVDREASSLKLRRMTTRWGTCNVRSRAVTLNLALAEREPDLLEYVVVHELTHLRVADHGPDFQWFMGMYLPDWKQRRRRLNSRAADAV